MNTIDPRKAAGVSQPSRAPRKRKADTDAATANPANEELLGGADSDASEAVNEDIAPQVDDNPLHVYAGICNSMPVLGDDLPVDQDSDLNQQQDPASDSEVEVVEVPPEVNPGADDEQVRLLQLLHRNRH